MDQKNWVFFYLTGESPSQTLYKPEEKKFPKFFPQPKTAWLKINRKYSQHQMCSPANQNLLSLSFLASWCLSNMTIQFSKWPSWEKVGWDGGWAQEGRCMTGWYSRKRLNLSLKFCTHFAHQISYLEDTFKYLFGSTDGWMIPYEQDETGMNLEEKTLIDRVWQNNLNSGIYL